MTRPPLPIARCGCLMRAAIFALAILAAAQMRATPPTAQRNEPVAITAGPYLQAPNDNSMTIMWLTNRNTDGWVEYGPPGGQWQKALSSRDGLIEANARIHKVTLSHLKPGTVYEYRVQSRDIIDFGAYKVQFGETVSSGPYQFRTPDSGKSEVAFAVFNDLHEDFATPGNLLATAGRACDFVAFNGDMVDSLEDESQVVSMLKAASEAFARQVPLIYVRGNHETRGKFARELANYVSSPAGRYYYSFDYGPVHFVVLDTGEDKLDSHWAYSGLVDFDGYRLEQAEWLKQEVRSPAFLRARYRVVFAHMPFPQVAAGQEAHGMSDANAKFGPILDAAGIDLFISAHQHQLALADPEPGKRAYCLVQGGGPKAPTLIHVSSTGKRLKADILNADGTTAELRNARAPLTAGSATRRRAEGSIMSAFPWRPALECANVPNRAS